MAERKPRRSGPRPPAPFFTVRHYCQGLGDCHLLTFRKTDGTPFHMLIDCGIHGSVPGGRARVESILRDILSITRHIDVLVITHEHMDHLSAFLLPEELLSQLSVGEVWMGWTENPADPQARALDRFKEQALALLTEANQRLSAAPDAQGLREGLGALLGFSFSLKGERVRTARNRAAAMGRVRYLEPHSGILTLPGIEDLRVYVLGPSRDQSFLRITERASEMYSAPAMALSGALAAGGDDPGAPFDANVGLPLDRLLATPGTEAETAGAAFLRTHYLGLPEPGDAPLGPEPAGAGWRRIDHDWLRGSATLALQLDERTNNTSLVLAFEQVQTGRVALFAGDAQIGSWLGWEDLSWPLPDGARCAAELLARTVYYKVGHHGSRNATARSRGLERMSSPDLVAFIPTHAADAARVKWHEMPFPPLLAALQARTAGRTLRADADWIGQGDPPADLRRPSGALAALRHGNCGPTGWIELDVV